MSNWRDNLSAIDRFRMVSKISDLHGLTNQEALTLETTAFTQSNSLSAYENACTSSNPPPSPPYRPATPPSPGISIGPFPNCHIIGSGVTSTVYRSGTFALKVIESISLPPHNAHREIRILQSQSPPCIPLLSILNLPSTPPILQFPYFPFSLKTLLSHHTTTATPIPRPLLHSIFHTLFTALFSLHSQGIIHRDIKPSSLLLASPTGPTYLSDFSSSWHPEFSLPTEPPNDKILDIGSGPWRAPEALFGNKSYGPSLDMWAAGTLLVECARTPPKSLFESPAINEYGNQLGLIVSIFKTMGSPTRETWPEAEGFRTPPFDIYAVFEGQPRDEVFGGIVDQYRQVAENLVVYESGKRWTAQQALEHPAFKEKCPKKSQNRT